MQIIYTEAKEHFIHIFKGELQPKISLLHMKVLTKSIKVLKQKVMFFFDTCNAVAACARRSKTKY